MDQLREKPTSASAFLQLTANILSVLESLRCGGLLLEADGRVRSHNATALGCLGDGLVIRGERLRATDRDTERRLQSILSCAGECGEGENRPSSVAVQRRARLPLVVRLVRLEHDAVLSRHSTVLLLLLLDPEQRQELPPEILTEAFELTKAECNVAIGIGAGKTLAEIAVARGVTIGTVRAHSKAVFAKTNTRGQAELTGVLTRLAFAAPRMELTVIGAAKAEKMDESNWQVRRTLPGKMLRRR